MVKGLIIYFFQFTFLKFKFNFFVRLFWSLVWARLLPATYL